MYELFPHVDCDQVRDIFEGVNQNIKTAADTLTAIYGQPPEDLSEQFKEIEAVVDGRHAGKEPRSFQNDVVYNPENYAADDDDYEVIVEAASFESSQ